MKKKLIYFYGLLTITGANACGEDFSQGEVSSPEITGTTANNYIYQVTNDGCSDIAFNYASYNSDSNNVQFADMITDSSPRRCSGDCHLGLFGSHCVDCAKGSKDFGTPACTFIDDRDPANKVTYNVVRIGQQVWMRENMQYSTAEIPCSKNDGATDIDSGCLYTWNDAQNICPAGWHTPSNMDFDILLRNAHAKNSAQEAFLALIAPTNWPFSELPQSEELGFSALPDSGYCSEHSCSYKSTIWTSNKYNESYAFAMTLTVDANFVNNSQEELFGSACVYYSNHNAYGTIMKEKVRCLLNTTDDQEKERVYYSYTGFHCY